MNKNQFHVISSLLMLIIIELIAFILIFTGEFVSLKNKYKVLKGDYIKLEEKVNKIKAELIIQNEYK